MRFRFLSLAILSITFLIVSAAAYAQQVSKEENERLQEFFKNRFGVNIPSDSKIEIEGFEKSPVGDLKSGKFIIASAAGAQEVPFVIGGDGKYILMGNVVDTKSFEATAIKGIKKGAVPIPRGEFPLLMTDDGKYLIINSEIVDTGTFKESQLKGFKGGSFVMGGSQQVPVYISDNGQYLVLGTEIMDTTIDPHQEIMEKIVLEDVPYKGNKDAEVVVVEYSDFQCPFCKRGKDMLPDILKSYDGKIKISFKQLPLRNHNWAMPAAVASVCAYQQGNDKFWAMHDKLFDNQKQITLENSEQKFKEYAKEIGLDTKKFDACVASPEVKAQVEKDVAEATAIGVQSTPTFVVNGMIVPGANPEGLKSAIDIKLSQGS
ncbi:MAG: thioredoxin domain-containing protein [Candidatus Dadabacteria bacterium]|nr:thioredoxin domain-containing protein [Candidatus Dadabacteria bacterium]